MLFGGTNVLLIFEMSKLNVKTDGEIDLDLQSAKHRREYPNKETITAIRIGYLNQNVYISTNVGTVEVWDFNLKEHLTTCKVFDKPINSLTFSKHFEFIVLTSDIGAKILDSETLELITEIRSDYPINCAQISPLMYRKKVPRFHLVMGGGTKARDTAFAKEGGLDINVMNAIHGTKICTLSGHYGPINWIECCPDGSGFLSAGEEAIVRYFRFDKKYHESDEFE